VTQTAPEQTQKTARWNIMTRLKLHDAFQAAVQVVVAVIVLLVILVLAIALGRVLISAVQVVTAQPLGRSLDVLIGDILGLLVIIELFRSFIEYQECQRLRVHSLVSAALVFVVRELVLTLYGNHGTGPVQLAGFGFVILCLGAVRALAIRYTPDSPGR